MNQNLNSVQYLNTPPPAGMAEGAPINWGAPEHIYSNSHLTINDLVEMFIVYSFIIAGALAAVFIFVGGVSFILSGGNEEKIKKAVNTIRYSIVGLIITVLSFTFVTIVGRIFGLNFLDYLSYEQIKTSIDRIIQTGESTIPEFRPPGPR